MPQDSEITYADHMGRFYARRYSFPPMVGRVLGYLAVCDPPAQSIAELADALLASRSAISGALTVLEGLHVVRRSRAAGERMDRVRIDMSTPQSIGMDISEYEELGELAREGLEVLTGAPAERRAVLLEMSAFAEFLVEQMPKLEAAWEQRRTELVASGALPSAAEAAHDRRPRADDRRQRRVQVVRRSVALDHVDLTVAEGTVFALLGPNGAGKTTLVRILSTLIAADAGQVQVGGHDVLRDAAGCGG